MTPAASGASGSFDSSQSRVKPDESVTLSGRFAGAADRLAPRPAARATQVRRRGPGRPHPVPRQRRRELAGRRADRDGSQRPLQRARPGRAQRAVPRRQRRRPRHAVRVRPRQVRDPRPRRRQDRQAGRQGRDQGPRRARRQAQGQGAQGRRRDPQDPHVQGRRLQGRSGRPTRPARAPSASAPRATGSPPAAPTRPARSPSCARPLASWYGGASTATARLRRHAAGRHDGRRPQVAAVRHEADRRLQGTAA